jgi:hypothetical protein
VELSRVEYNTTWTGALGGWGGRVLKFALSHAKLGGVTESWWRFVLFERDASVKPTSRPVGHGYERTLQTVLDDTVGRIPKPDSLIEHAPKNVALNHGAWGMVIPHGTKKCFPVYDGGQRMPDLFTFRRGAPADRPWVRSRSVFTPGVPVVRPIRYAELLGAWDYEGKLEARNWEPRDREAVLEQRLNSPPGKMLREVSFLLLELIRPNLPGAGSSPKGPTRGLTADVPVGALEREADAKLAAATADDAEVDLTQWALPAETPEEGPSPHDRAPSAVECRSGEGKGYGAANHDADVCGG